MKLLGYEVDPAIAQARHTLAVTLYWQATCPIDRNYSVFVHHLDDLELVVAGEDTFPGLGSFPTTQWQPGDAVADTYLLGFLPRRWPALPASWKWVCTISPRESDCPCTYEGGNWWENRFADLPLESQTKPPHLVGVFFDFQGLLALVAYDLDQVVLSPGQKLDLTLYWRMLAETDEDYWVVARLVGNQGQVLLQETDQLQFKGLPTSALCSGQVIEHKHVLLIPPDVADPGIYELQLSVYSSVTGWPLTVIGSTGEPRGTELGLLRIRIAER
ncbi:MAG TPA: hypothetical protein DCP08_02670 [Chloroflexi bacterium]|nr:hypothetical protein [Chloroflexota bacterium]